MKLTKITQVIIASMLSLPYALAATIDWKPISQAIGSVWSLLGAFFSFEYVSKNPAVLDGILRFLVFILIVRVVQAGATKVFEGRKNRFGSADTKTPTVIGIVVGALTVWFTRNVIIISGLVMLIVPIIIIGGLVYYAFVVLTGERLKHFFGAVLMFIAGIISSAFLQIYQYPAVRSRSFSDIGIIPNFVPEVLNVIAALVWLLFLIKLLQWAFNGEWPLKKKAGTVPESASPAAAPSTRPSGAVPGPPASGATPSASVTPTSPPASEAPPAPTGGGGNSGSGGRPAAPGGLSVTIEDGP